MVTKNGKYNFRKIFAKEDIFEKTREENEEFLDRFRFFTALETVKSGRAQDGKSGKARSYMMYLVRLFIIINESKDKPLEIDSIGFYNELKLMQESANFQEYNKSEGRFPNATIESYFEYWLNDAFMEDDIYNNQVNETSNIDDYESVSNDIAPKEIPDKILVNGKGTYPRDMNITQAAKEKARWLCEFDNSHNTFISKKNGLSYVEAHHLIPMALQENYDYSLDILPNVISLCPNCHRMIHNGINSDKKKVLNKLYPQRKDNLRLAGINISFKDLLTLYSIND